MTPYHYLRAPDNYFWHWDESGDVAEINGGATIAFRELLADILLYIKDQGLPPFGSLLLAVIATNDNAARDIEWIGDLVKPEVIVRDENPGSLLKVHADALAFLHTLAKLPPAYKKGNNRLYLLQTIFHKSHHQLSLQKSKLTAATLNSKDLDKTYLATPQDYHPDMHKHDVRPLAILHRRFPDVTAIIEKMKDLPDLANDIAELPVADEEETSKDFIDELIADPKTFHIGRLIKPLWAGFTIPINTSVPSSHEFGGISDLTNKGDFDKLLLSEFANDELTFLSRLANNEALYLHREMPPSADKDERLLLLDISLKSWGAPKIISMAAAVAIARHPKSTQTTTTFTVGENYETVDVFTTENIIKASFTTAVELHPAQGIRKLMQERTKKEKPEAWLFLHPDTLQEPELQLVLSEFRAFIKYIITFNASGHIVFYQYKINSRKQLHQVYLNLEKLWTKQEPLPAAIAPARDLAEENYPLLFPQPQQIKARFQDRSGYYLVADNRLFRQHRTASSQKRGYSVLLHKLPANGSFCMGTTAAGETLFLYFEAQNKLLRIVNLHTTKVSGHISFTKWKDGDDAGFFFADDTFYHYNRSGWYSFILNNNAIEMAPLETISNKLLAIQERNRKTQQENKKEKAGAKSILKNVTEIYINAINNLTLNQHELKQYGNTLLIESSGYTTTRAKAQRSGNTGVFEFADNSRATIHPSGMLILESSNTGIPTIYISLVLNAGIAMATETEFCGNDYYMPVPENNQASQFYQINLKAAGASKLQLVHVLKMELGLGLKEAKEIVDGLMPQRIGPVIYKGAAAKVLTAITNAGAAAEIVPAIKQQKTGIETFYDKNVMAFINNILQHAPEH